MGSAPFGSGRPLAAPFGSAARPFSGPFAGAGAGAGPGRPAGSPGPLGSGGGFEARACLGETGRTCSSGGLSATIEREGTDWVTKTEPPKMLPEPSTVSPPSTVALA